MIAPTAHSNAIAAAAQAIRRPRYLMYACTDQELAELVVREYYKALPPRPKRGRRRTPSATEQRVNQRFRSAQAA
jgi:hypothetical protein